MTRKFIIWRMSKCLWLGLMLLAVSCGFVYQGEWLALSQEASLTGRVLLETGRGLEDVEAKLVRMGVGMESDETWDLSLSQRGEFRIEELPAGEYYLQVTKPRYSLYFQQFDMEEDEAVYIEVELGRYSIPADIWEVLVVGSFLDWDPLKALPMADEDSDGLWETAIPLSSGRYSYRYIINGLDEWFIDIDSGQYEPDGYGYYNSVVELQEAQLVSFHLDTNDPWFHRDVFESPAAQEDGGYVLWEPEEPRRGQEIFLLYDPRGGPLEAAAEIFLYWGANDWTVPKTIPPGSIEVENDPAVLTPMEPDDGGLWWAEIPTDAETSVVDFAFTDGELWDDNGGQDWHVEVR